MLEKDREGEIRSFIGSVDVAAAPMVVAALVYAIKATGIFY